MTRTVRATVTSLMLLTLGWGSSGCSVPYPLADHPRFQSDNEEPDLNDLITQHDALDAYVELEQANILELMSRPNSYSAISAEGIYPGTIEYDYVYAVSINPFSPGPWPDLEPQSSNPFAPQSARTTWGEIAVDLEKACGTVLFPDMARAGITLSPKVKYTYFNLNGSELWSYTCE